MPRQIKPVCHNHWKDTAAVETRAPKAHVWHSATREATAVGSPGTAAREWPVLSAAREGPTEDPGAATKTQSSQNEKAKPRGLLNFTLIVTQGLWLSCWPGQVESMSNKNSFAQHGIEATYADEDFQWVAGK